MIFNLHENKKQYELLQLVLKIIQGASKVRQIFFGGAIRGGKTFGCLLILVLLCKIYKRSRWVVVRESLPSLKATAIPSLEKIVAFSRGKWHKGDQYYFEFRNGSRIIFMAENYANDKDLDRFKGLEVNGFLLEQIEELQYKTYMKCIERAGSWYIDPMPPALIMGTFNPAFNWVKDVIYDKAMAGVLPPTIHFIQTLPSDNPHVTDDQRAAWEMLDDDSKARFIEGNWEIEVKGQFLRRFDPKKHLREVPLRDDEYLWFSFDFNVDPMTCTVFQTDQYTFHNTIKELRMEDSDLESLCDELMTDYPGHYMHAFVTGDATGLKREVANRGGLSHYDTIMNRLGLSKSQIRVPLSNPLISNSRVFCNSILQHFPNVTISPTGCPYLIKDMQFVMAGVDREGKLCIEKHGKNPYINMDNSKLGHLLDTWRYGVHTTLRSFVKIPHS